MKSRFDNWSDLRVFLAVLREGSTLAASRKLGMAQPTVARRIDALEHALGMTLFDRDTRGFKPTAYACELCAEAEAVEGAVESLVKKADTLAHPKPIRITAFSENLQASTVELLSAFNRDYPDVRFEFLPGAKTVDLMAGEADVALRISFTPPDPDLIQRRISTAQFSIYGTQAYADEHGLPASVDDFDGHTFVSPWRPDMNPFLHNWIRERVSPDQIVTTYSEIDLMLSAIKSGSALGVVNVRMARDHPELIQCFDPPSELDVPHLILIPPEAWRRPEIKAFIKFFAPRYAARFRDGGGS